MHRSIRRGMVPLLAALALGAGAHAARAQALDSVYRADANRLIQAALADTFGWKRLATLVDRFGPRLSGSQALENTIDWSLDQMRRDGLQNVRGEPVMVPHWVRGQESAELVSPRPVPLHMVGLGGSVGTPAGGVTADVIVVTSEDELKARGAEARGKIILFDVPFTTYGETVRWRSLGAAAAARAGAAASLIRSVSSFSMQNPHTGSMRYVDTTVARIPAAALSTEDAMMLHRMQDRGEHIRVHLAMGAQTLSDAPSRNTVAEIVGREKPDEVVVISGHLDSWDVGTGAMDDAGGAVAAWEAVRLMRELGLRPRRTVRVVMWTNEENGTRGGRGYRDAHQAELGRHQLAIESDNGVFRPYGFRFQGTDAALATMRQIARLLEPIGAAKMDPGEGEADVDAIIRDGVPGLALDVDGTKYFWYHHSSADTIDKLDPQEFAKCVAAMAVMAYVAADMPGTLPHAAPAPGR
ncbi:MAG TPA: M20/M25/M40 family metallo-hydrolase [Longimicrobium sp.]|nr:M20/M25/M40 family metallo-hydrolase [Longimicrobium sp.]